MGRNIVITGFMGTGKTTIGELIAGRLSMKFYDTDSIVAKHAGISIPEIFATFGEPYFRRLEKNVMTELRDVRNSVIATGGGTLLDRHNRELLGESGIMICLNARPEIIFNRLKGNNGRPLLINISEKRVTDLLNKRRDVYDFCTYQVDTSDKSFRVIVEEIIKLYHLEDGNRNG